MTRRRLIVRSAARTDILRYVRYLLEHDARAAAERFPDAVDHALERLLDMPGIGVLQAFTHPQHSKRNLRHIFSLKSRKVH
ncbi:MAG: type II toxin-antitoxin system RelE/ParE family toxin [Deltaproteobacteria bacterium]|nr:type II toxin-antitoxin system RelE/ParE family toxin [Deltaproteobacteria bacterium]